MYNDQHFRDKILKLKEYNNLQTNNFIPKSTIYDTRLYLQATKKKPSVIKKITILESKDIKEKNKIEQGNIELDEADKILIPKLKKKEKDKIMIPTKMKKKQQADIHDFIENNKSDIKDEDKELYGGGVDDKNIKKVVVHTFF
jgi:hypothetical protein